ARGRVAERLLDRRGGPVLDLGQVLAARQPLAKDVRLEALVLGRLRRLVVGHALPLAELEVAEPRVARDVRVEVIANDLGGLDRAEGGRADDLAHRDRRERESDRLRLENAVGGERDLTRADEPAVAIPVRHAMTDEEDGRLHPGRLLRGMTLDNPTA